MSHEEYRRLYAACVAMARQSSLPNVRDRWLAMAAVWLERARDYETKNHPSRLERSQHQRPA
jgi:hypothetical protein